MPRSTLQRSQSADMFNMRHCDAQPRKMGTTSEGDKQLRWACPATKCPPGGPRGPSRAEGCPPTCSVGNAQAGAAPLGSHTSETPSTRSGTRSPVDTTRASDEIDEGANERSSTSLPLNLHRTHDRCPSHDPCTCSLLAGEVVAVQKCATCYMTVGTEAQHCSQRKGTMAAKGDSEYCAFPYTSPELNNGSVSGPLTCRPGAANVPHICRPRAAHAPPHAPRTWAVRGRCVAGAWPAPGRHVGGVWAACGRRVGGT